MALLNFANTYAEISGNLSLQESLTGDYVKLFFSKDGHIISHGKDFTPTFTPIERGLVPLSSGKQTEILRGNATWAEITTSDLPIASSVQEAILNNTTETTILTTKQIIDYINSQIIASDAMVYKGTIKYEGDSYITTTNSGVSNEFPTSCTVGDTYRITGSGRYGGLWCENGDLLICIKDGSGDSLNSSEYWTAVEANINGSVTHHINNTPISVYSDKTTTFTIYAPTDSGIQGQILLSGGGNTSPGWVNPVDLTVGTANKVANDLIAGIGLTLGEDVYNGSAERTLSLLGATSTSIGGVIIGDNITISDGTISLTRENIINALGYNPPSTDTWRDIKVAGTSIGNKVLNFMPTGDIYVRAGDGDPSTDDFDISFGLSWWNISANNGQGAYEHE